MATRYRPTRAKYAAGTQGAAGFLLEVWGFTEVPTDDLSSGVVFNVAKAEGAQPLRDLVRREVADERFTGAGETIRTRPQMRTVLVGVCRL